MNCLPDYNTLLNAYLEAQETISELQDQVDSLEIQCETYETIVNGLKRKFNLSADGNPRQKRLQNYRF